MKKGGLLIPDMEFCVLLKYTELHLLQSSLTQEEVFAGVDALNSPISKGLDRSGDDKLKRRCKLTPALHVQKKHTQRFGRT